MFCKVCFVQNCVSQTEEIKDKRLYFLFSQYKQEQTEDKKQKRHYWALPGTSCTRRLKICTRSLLIAYLLAHKVNLISNNKYR